MQPFPELPDEFLKESLKLLKATNRDAYKITMDQFEEVFPTLAAGQQDAIIATCNLMAPLGMRVHPHLESYLRAVVSDAEDGAGFFNVWNPVLTSLLNDSRRGAFKGYERYMTCINGLLTEQALYTTRSKKWSISADRFDVEYAGGSPQIHVQTNDLIGTTQGDTAVFYETKGYYDINSETWYGQGGRHTWESVGLIPEDVYCKLPNSYTIDLGKHQYRVDSVLFVFKPYFSDASLGVLTNQLQQTKNPRTTAYPQYVSYQNKVKIKDLMEGVDFEGVFKLEGSTIKGSSDEGAKAKFKFYSTGGKLLAAARANSFKIDTREKAVSLEAALSIYFAEDSIYHPGLNFKFDVNKREMIATRGETGISDSKFFNSHHKMEMDVDKLIWKLDDDQITMSNPGRGGQDPAFFESVNLFDRKLYNYYLGVTSYNPLIVMKRYCEQFNVREIGAETLARQMSPTLTTDQIRHLLFRLMSDGFIIYDQDKELVYVQDKVLNYVDAYLEKVDYDILKFQSVTPAASAEMDLETMDMKINGLERASLSHKQFVHVYPDNDVVTVKQNRDMVFNGTVLAGRIDFYGKGYYFNYDSFYVNMVNLDSMLINVPTDKKDEFGQQILEPMRGLFENLSGTLFIDAPVNKSGNGEFPGYSRFVNRNPSYVYYDQYSKHQDKYPREAFYFKTHPFTIDSLDDFNIFNQAFPGEFHSADIFPTLEQDLNIRPDKSFGFYTQTPAEGLPLYQGRGRYYDAIDLSNDGLLGQGRVEFLSTTLSSDDIIFFPDSMASNVDSMVMVARNVGGVDFPDARNESVFVSWRPYDDDMLVEMKEKPFDFFNGYATLTGDIRVKSTGARAAGALDWKEATLTSNDFSFGTFSTQADTSSLKIKSLSPDKVAFNLPNVESDVDFDERVGTFITNVPEVATELPYNRYKTSMGRFDWDFDAKTIDLSPPQGREFATFTSTHPRQDSLSFLAKHGLFNMETSLLTAYDVPRIAVADAWVIPSEGRVTIGEDAVMHKLLNSEIVVDTTTQHHRFYNAEVEIFGKKSYRAVADYDYVHRGGNPQTLRFQEIGVETSGDTARSYGVATIVQADSFRLDPRIRFEGQAKLEAGDEYMTFRGISEMEVPVFPYIKYSYQIDTFDIHQTMVDSFRANPDYAHYKVVFPAPEDTVRILSGMVTLMHVDSTPVFENPNITHDWFRIDDEINPAAIEITVTDAVDARNEPVFTGIHIRSDSALLYATLLGDKLNGRDETVFKADGLVSYNPDRNEYLVISQDSTDGKGRMPTKLTYNNSNGSVHAEGFTDLGLDVQWLNVDAAGQLWKTTSDSTYYFDMVIGFGFKMTKAVWNEMTADIESWTYDKPDLDFESAGLKSKLSMLMPSRAAADKLFNNYNMTGRLNFPPESDYGVVVSTTMIWDANEKTFRSYGPIGIIAINGKEIGREVKGYLEIGKMRSSDYINLYLQPSTDEWYYLNYRKNELGAFSASDAFNNVVKAVPDNQRLYKGDGDKDFMIFEIGSRATMARFVRKMQYFESLIRNK